MAQRVSALDQASGEKRDELKAKLHEIDTEFGRMRKMPQLVACLLESDKMVTQEFAD